MLLNLISHFCYDGKSLKLATELAQSKYHLNSFFDEMITFHCDCIDKIFTSEIGANFSEWFAKCVPIFMRTMMLNENERLESFSSEDWPHNKRYINVKYLAKTGFYYTGQRDIVSCAFCRIELHDWKFNDNPILDHYKFSPKCPFLIDSKRCLNVPIGSNKKLERLLSVIPKNNVSDEVDLKN